MQVLRKAFKQQLDQAVTEFVASVEADKALIEVDIQGSIAHAEMLTSAGLLTQFQGDQIIHGLKKILTEVQEGIFVLNPEFEDVHMNVEKRLEQIIGENALRLHTARSRNDQVALDVKLFVLAQINSVKTLVKKLQCALAEAGLNNIDVVMPGYTHLQRAQPVLFAHAMHAFIEQLERDYSRFGDAARRASVCPLGAGAQAGTSLPIDPHQSAALLGFDCAFTNSIDAVSDRDFVAEFLFASSLTAVHLSQLAETLIIWASQEFGFVTFSDAVTTASSLMPQKKNPDPVELVRAKSGAMFGELINILTILKGLPLGYNRDLQETKPPAIRVAKELSSALKVMTVAIENMTVNADKTLLAASDPDMITTDLVEYLVRKGVPFRQAHEQVSQLTAFARTAKTPISSLDLGEYQSFAKEFETDVFDLFDPAVSVLAKVSHGSTGKLLVSGALSEAHAKAESNANPKPEVIFSDVW